MGKFFNITVKPTITASLQHAAVLHDGDVLFDWTAFNVPKGASKLVNVTALIRGTDGARQTFAMNLYFAKTSNGVVPGSLGTLHATADGTGYQNNLIGGWQIEESDYIGSTGSDIMTLSSARYQVTAGTDNRSESQVIVPLVLQGEPDSGLNVGYDKLYVGCVTPDGAAAFSTGVVTSQIVDVSAISAAELVNADIQGTDPRLVFAPGDIIHAEDDIILGEVLSVPDTNTINFKADGSKQYHAGGEVLHANPANFAAWQVQNGAAAAGDIASGEELYNLHPVTLILQFEK